MNAFPGSRNPLRKVLHVIDANCSWIRSLVEAMPPDWHVRNYRIYNPWWLPGGKADLLRVFRPRPLSCTRDEVFCVVPGWNRHPVVSAWLVQLWIRRSLAQNPQGSAVLFTFPFYSGLAAWVRCRFPSVKVLYHAHDPFEFYSYPDGYVRTHEDRLVPLCHQVLAISEKLAEDFRARYPGALVSALGNATAAKFLHAESRGVPQQLEKIRSAGRPVVGCVGQINSSYDWRLLEAAATDNPSTQFVFVGSVFEEGHATDRIRRYLHRPNVHWVGSVAHNELPAHMRAFDICLNPLSVNPHNDRRDALRLYDYLTTSRPVFSTAVACANKHQPHVEVFTDSGALVSSLRAMPRELTAKQKADRLSYIRMNTWESRCQTLVKLFDDCAVSAHE